VYPIWTIENFKKLWLAGKKNGSKKSLFGTRKQAICEYASVHKAMTAFLCSIFPNDTI